ncbi:hypothetical protein IFR05_010241 [Cadophora sp. M221]|nr:hypothetical protein IFR05_010241 [Cadophora sp. M221]
MQELLMEIRNGFRETRDIREKVTLIKTASRNLDREIKVKVRNSHSIQALRRLTEEDIKERITQALAAEPATANLASQVTAAKQLKSGDIMIYTTTTEGAEALKGKRKWLSSLGTKSEILEETYGVPVHRVPVNRVNVNNQAQII